MPEARTRRTRDVGHVPDDLNSVQTPSHPSFALRSHDSDSVGTVQEVMPLLCLDSLWKDGKTNKRPLVTSPKEQSFSFSKAGFPQAPQYCTLAQAVKLACIPPLSDALGAGTTRTSLQ